MTTHEINRAVARGKPAQLFFDNLIRFAFFAVYFLVPFSAKTGLIIVVLMPFLLARLPRLQEVVFIVILAAALCGYFFWGSHEIKPIPLEFSQSLSRLVVSLLCLTPIFFVRADNVSGALMWLMIGTLSFVFYEGVSTLRDAPQEILKRYMLHPFTGDELDSTGQINAAAMACGFLLFVSRKTIAGWIGLAAVIFLSVVYSNRTGTLLTLTFVFIWLLLSTSAGVARRWIVFGAIIVASVLLFEMNSQLVEDQLGGIYTRLTKEGLQTERYTMQVYGLHMLFSGEYPLGGAQVAGVGDSIWYHNVFLDAYRVAGIPDMILFLALAFMSLRCVLVLRSFELLVAWTAALLVACTSVPLEGGPVEYYAIFSVFTYAMVAPKDARAK